MNAMRLWLWSLSLFSATLTLHTRHNTFPFYYHQDEPGKVEQVLGIRPWNFHHPMLLLSTTKLVASNARTEQTVVEAGRWVSATFTAGAVVALSLLGYVWRGWLVAILTGITLLLHHQLFELSHYLKEDPALLFGIAIALLGAHVFARKPGTAAALLLGTGCGLAISGKYLGVVSLLFAVPVLWRTQAHGRPRIAALSAMLLVLVAVNFPLLRDPATFIHSVSHETEQIVEGHGKMTQSVPHTRYWNVFLANTTPAMWLLLLVLLWSCARHRREWRTLDWITLAFPFALAIALSFSPKDNDRYFLPATAIFTLLSAVGVVEVARHFDERKRIVEIIAGTLLVLAQLPSWTANRGGLIKYWQAFQSDDNAELVAWLRTNTAPAAIIAKDEKIRLPEVRRHGIALPVALLPNQILSKEYVADLSKSKSIDGLRAMGVSYILITDNTYKTFERTGMKPKKSEADDYERRKLFYAELQRDYEPLRTWPRSNVISLHPGIKIYCIAP